ncbi:hypothetical protein CFE53_02540 [Methanofervidicoccus sp. A16]|nr:hypothetical protein CFE53_02540 [Methanofervidicoccus sp. A16]
MEWSRSFLTGWLLLILLKIFNIFFLVLFIILIFINSHQKILIRITIIIKNKNIKRSIKIIEIKTRDK